MLLNAKTSFDGVVSQMPTLSAVPFAVAWFGTLRHEVEVGKPK